MPITFVSSFLHIYDTPYDHRNNEWRIERFKEVAATGIQIALFISPEFISIMENLKNMYPNLRILRVLSIQQTKIWKLWVDKKNQLPQNRKSEKDTIEYLSLMNSKIEFLADTIRENPFGGDYFAWLDFNITHVFKNIERTVDFIRFLGKCRFKGKFLTIPGCWNKVNDMNQITDKICWRFCGGFFMGHRESILNFEKLVWEHASTISPIWEVNLWALVEWKSQLFVEWFSADHNDSMICNISARIYSVDLNSLGIKVKWRDVEYPVIKYFQPSSISHCHYRGRDLVNVRFLNYHLLPNGYYYYPDGRGKIENINMLSILDESMEPKFGFTKMKEKGLALIEKDAFSKGLEDIRLFESDGVLRFIATSAGYTTDGKNKMIIGDYNEQTGEFFNGSLINSPFHSECEKNWIPLPYGKHFIYSWYPYRVGKVRGTTLEIVDEVMLSAAIFEKVRGSTIFVKWEGADGRFEEKYLGIVHFSENDSPRHYFHMFVVLDEKTNRPISYSQPFRFYEEFGIDIHEIPSFLQSKINSLVKEIIKLREKTKTRK